MRYFLAACVVFLRIRYPQVTKKVHCRLAKGASDVPVQVFMCM